MILSDAGIKKAIEEGRLVIDPIPSADQYTTSAVDLRIGADFRKWDEKLCHMPGTKISVDLTDVGFPRVAGGYLKPYPPESDGNFVIPPYAVTKGPILAMTHERVEFKPNSGLAARVEGRSSFARLGLTVHQTAPTVHANFSGAGITLEIINHGPFYITLVPGKTPICQLIIEKLDSLPEGQINTSFQNQTSPAGKN